MVLPRELSNTTRSVISAHKSGLQSKYQKLGNEIEEKERELESLRTQQASVKEQYDALEAEIPEPDEVDDELTTSPQPVTDEPTRIE